MDSNNYISVDALDLHRKLKAYANGSRVVDLNLAALRAMHITFSGMFVSHLIELKKAGLIAYHVNDIPSIELLQ